MEAEEMIKGIREEGGRPFDPKRLVVSSTANVIVTMAFGRRCDDSDEEFQRAIADITEGAPKVPFELEFFPLLRSLPYYKRKTADTVSIAKRDCDFVTRNIASCLQVVYLSFCLSVYPQSIINVPMVRNGLEHILK